MMRSASASNSAVETPGRVAASNSFSVVQTIFPAARMISSSRGDLQTSLIRTPPPSPRRPQPRSQRPAGKGPAGSSGGPYSRGNVMRKPLLSSLNRVYYTPSGGAGLPTTDLFYQADASLYPAVP